MLRFSTDKYERINQQNYLKKVIYKNTLYFITLKSPKGALVVKVYKEGNHLLSLYLGVKSDIPKIYFERKASYVGNYLTQDEMECVMIELNELKHLKEILERRGGLRNV